MPQVAKIGRQKTQLLIPMRQEAKGINTRVSKSEEHFKKDFQLLKSKKAPHKAHHAEA